MLRSNSKKARENLRTYIMDHFDPSNYDDVNQEPETFQEVATIIWEIFQIEKYYSLEAIRKYGIPMQKVFSDWCGGLPSILDTCYYYNRSAADDLGLILEETDEEKARYSEAQACETLTRLIYREISKEVLK